MDLRSHTRVFRSLTLPIPRSLPHSFITPTPKNKMNGSAYLWPLDQKEDVDTGLPVSRMLFSYTVPKSQLESPPQVQQTYARLIPLSFLHSTAVFNETQTHDSMPVIRLDPPITVGTSVPYPTWVTHTEPLAHGIFPLLQIEKSQPHIFRLLAVEL